MFANHPPFRVRPISAAAIGAAALIVLAAAPAAQELIENREGVRFEPAIVDATDARIASLQVPDGFRVEVFASGLGAPRMFAIAPEGTLFVTRRESGDVVALRDTDGDGRSDARSIAVSGLDGVHGIALRDGKMYLATVDAIYSGPVEGTRVGNLTRVFANLPPGGRHPNRTLAFGPDGNLFISVGSTCNLCVEPHRFSATILRMPLGGKPAVFARGLRNTLGFAWHPETGEMWGMDNGADWLGNQVPPEELNRLREGGDYGWPFLYGDNQIVDLQDYTEEFDPASARQTAIPSVAEYDAHAAPMQMVFYTGTQFPDEYRNDAFAAMRGSWNRKNPAGYELVRVRFDERGEPAGITAFLTGFLSKDGTETFGRPVGVAAAQDGSLLVGDDTNGVIYRISSERR